jgi:glycosyltransferase involved in cell wall biosynthesis
MIYIDASSAVENRAGLGRYSEELIRALVARSTANDEYAVFYHDAAAARPSRLIKSLPSVTTKETTRLWRLRVLLAHLADISQDELLTSPVCSVGRGIPHIFHATEHVLPRFKKARTVFTLHDLNIRYFPDHHPFFNRIYLLLSFPVFLRRADAIICVSEQTRRDVRSFYQVPDHKISVIYEGVDARFRRVTDLSVLKGIRERYSLPDRFILAVGTIEPRKNLKTLFEAYAELLKEDDLHRSTASKTALGLVVVGKRGWMVEDTMDALKKLGLQEIVRLVGYVADEDLPAVYSLADVFAFPSLYEGFGLPPLEAMACSVPVVCSAESSLPEVIGKAGLLIPPTDARAWKAVLVRILVDNELRKDLGSRGPLQAARFTWDDAAEKTRTVYDGLM